MGLPQDTAAVDLDAERCYRALSARDPRFDGRFFVAVRTTGIYCRPICPARTPKPENIEFLPTAAAAEEQGYRACRRCRPDSALDAGEWSRGTEVLARALRCIDEGRETSVGAVSSRVGVGPRHLSRLFQRHLGAPPVRVAQTRRAHFARKLIDETDLPMTAIAHAAGFSSVRRFNALIKQRFGDSPSALRGGRCGRKRGDVLRLRLPFRAPYDFDGVLAFLAPRAIPGVEEVDGATYRRTLRLADGAASIAVSLGQGDALAVECDGVPTGELPDVVARVRDLFDLRLDPAAVDDALGHDPRLAPTLSRQPGIRVPGAFDGFELAVRAILGQQVSVRGATTLAGRLVEQHGDRVGSGAFLFPEPGVAAEADLTAIGVPRARAAAIHGLAVAVASGALDLRAGSDPDEGRRRLLELPGVGPWTADYVSMRAFGHPDAFPSGDLGLRKAAGVGAPVDSRELLRISERWRPWRAYAAMALWRSLGDGDSKHAKGG